MRKNAHTIQCVNACSYSMKSGILCACFSPSLSLCRYIREIVEEFSLFHFFHSFPHWPWCYVCMAIQFGWICLFVCLFVRSKFSFDQAIPAFFNFKIVSKFTFYLDQWPHELTRTIKSKARKSLRYEINYGQIV